MNNLITIAHVHQQLERERGREGEKRESGGEKRERRERLSGGDSYKFMICYVEYLDRVLA